MDRIGQDVHEVDENAWVEQDESLLYAACRMEDFEAAVEFTVRPVDGRIEVTAHGVGRPDANHAWAPLEVVPRDPPLFRFAGTVLLDAAQVRADFFGESCVFPAARYVFDVLCEAHRTGKLYPDGEVPSNRHSIPTLVGHSLGGAAVQYIALHRGGPPRGPSAECDGVKAYAFGSIGLETVPAGAQVGLPSSLETYLSTCDWMTQLLFPGRFQAGRIVSIRSWSHVLDSIQSDLCECTRGDGTSSPIGSSPPGVTNSEFCWGGS